MCMGTKVQIDWVNICSVVQRSGDEDDHKYLQNEGEQRATTTSDGMLLLSPFLLHHDC